MNSEHKEKKKHNNNEKICLHFRHENELMEYKLKKQQKLERAMVPFCENLKQPRQNVSFFWKGKELSGLETSETMGLVNYDKIDTYVFSYRDEESNSHSQENRQKPQMVVSAQKTVTREDANNNLEFGSRAEKLQTLGPKVEKWMAKAHSLEEKIKSSEKEYVNQIKALREEIGQKSAALKVCQDQNYEMKLEMKQMKLNHSNELQSVKNRVTADLKKQLYDDLKQSQAGMSKLNSPSSVKATGKQRSCHNCGVRSRFCVTFAYCNQYCKGIFLKKMYEDIQRKRTHEINVPF